MQCLHWTRVINMIRTRLLNSWRQQHLANVAVRHFILGIESSCDDTAAAIVSPQDGRLLGEAMSTQLSSRLGGVIPSISMGYHAIQLPKVVEEACAQAQVKLEQIVAVAVTTKPGLQGSLSTGIQYSKYLCQKYHKPLIPIHHMEAHALTSRMVHHIDFPFMVLLISGGHCLLAMAQDINQYLLLGSSMDNSPGETLDKVARRLRLQNLRLDLRDCSGGKAIQIIAEEGCGDPHAFDFRPPLLNERSCRFSFGGLRSRIISEINRMEKSYGLGPDELLPCASDLCASVQQVISTHLCQRLQRGIEYADLTSLWGPSRSLVVSGGVACNPKISGALRKVCQELGVSTCIPEPKYCTDNGVMIAWNAFEKWRRGIDILPTDAIWSVKPEPRATFGTDIQLQVIQSSLKCKWIKI